MIAAKPTLTLEELDALKARLKATWMTGDYELFARFLEKDADMFFKRLHVQRGSLLLDVGCGTGQVALIAARAGARVIGCDIATNLLEAARRRAASEWLDARFDEADAEALPYGDGQFDFVVSLFGAMFAPVPDLVAQELTRVCRPGGTVAMASWTPSSFVGKMFHTIGNYVPPSGAPSPLLWGDPAAIRDRFSSGIRHIACTRRTYHFDYPFPPEDVVEFFRLNYGPLATAFASLDPGAQQRLRADLVELWRIHNIAPHQNTRIESEYLEVIATRA